MHCCLGEEQGVSMPPQMEAVTGAATLGLELRAHISAYLAACGKDLRNAPFLDCCAPTYVGLKLRFRAGAEVIDEASAAPDTNDLEASSPRDLRVTAALELGTFGSSEDEFANSRTFEAGAFNKSDDGTDRGYPEGGKL